MLALRHGDCPEVWRIHPATLREENRFSHCQQVSTTEASWLGWDTVNTSLFWDAVLYHYFNSCM